MLTAWAFLGLLKLLVLSASQTIQLPLLFLQAEVPVISLKKLCQATETPQQETMDVILDTGSSAFWLASDACSNCPKTASLCPHLNSKSERINYITGSVAGQFSYINICGLKTKFLCVNEAQDIQQFKTNGVLGLGRKSNEKQISIGGLQFIKKYIESLPAVRSSKGFPKILTFYYGLHEKKLILGKVNEKYIWNFSETGKVSPLFSQSVKGKEDWSFKSDKIYFSDHLISLSGEGKSIQVVIDTGSSHNVLPKAIFQILFEQIKTGVSSACEKKQEGIVCPDHTAGVLSTLQLKIETKSLNFTLQKQFLYEVSKEGSLCFLVLQSNSDYLIMGTPFLRKYLLSLNLELESLQLTESNYQIMSSYEFTNGFIVFACLFLFAIAIVSSVLLVIDIIEKTWQRKVII